VACVTWRTRVDRNLRVLTPFAWAQHRWWCVERVCASLRIATAMEGDEMARAGAFRRGRCSPSTVAQSDARRRRRRKERPSSLSPRIRTLAPPTPLRSMTSNLRYFLEASAHVH